MHGRFLRRNRKPAKKMFMSCCCTDILEFCSQSVCGSIDFGITAGASGKYKMVGFFLDTQITVVETFTLGDKLIFPLTRLNESYQYTVELYNPTGERIKITKDDIEYDCFRFKTVMNITETKEEVLPGVEVIDHFEESADFNYSFSDLYMIYKIVIQCRDATGATVSVERLVNTGDILMQQVLAQYEWTSVTMDIFPADSEDAADTTIYFKTTGLIRVTIYKLKL